MLVLRKVKKLLPIVVIGTSVAFGAVVVDRNTTTLSEFQAQVISTEREAIKTGRYEQVRVTEIKDHTVSVDEYDSPNGRGYQVNIIRNNQDGTKDIMSYGEGPEAESRSFDWIKFESP